MESGAFVLHSVCAAKPVETLRVPLSGETPGNLAASAHVHHPTPSCSRDGCAATRLSLPGSRPYHIK